MRKATFQLIFVLGEVQGAGAPLLAAPSHSPAAAASPGGGSPVADERPFPRLPAP